MTLLFDTHTHVIGASGRYPLTLGDYASGTAWVHESPVTAEELLAAMDAAGVDRAVLVQAYGAYRTDNSYILDARKLAPERFEAAAIVDVWDADVTHELERLAAAGVHGLRLFAVGADATAERFAPEPVWRAADDLGLRVSLATVPAGLATLERELASYHHIEVSLDHCGFATGADLAHLADYSNLLLKVTTNILDMVPVPADFVAELAASFGPHRLMWGSDWSQTNDRPYTELAELGRSATSGLSAEAATSFLSGNAERVWSPAR